VSLNTTYSYTTRQASEDEQLNGGQGDSDPEGLEEWQSDLESDEDVSRDLMWVLVTARMLMFCGGVM